MPRYEYTCDACGKNFEVTHKMTDPDVTDCECGAKGTVHRLISAGSGVIFKGSGFYSTDYKTGAKPTSTTGDAAPAAAATTTASGSEGTPAKKPAGGGGHTCGSGCSHG